MLMDTTFDFKTVKDRVKETIKNNIICLEFKPGFHLTLKQLGSAFPCDSEAIELALLELVDEGLLYTDSEMNYYISYIDLKAIKDFVDFRFLLERQLSVEIISAVKDEDFVQLKEINNIMQMHVKNDNNTEAIRFDKKFHQYLYEIIGRNNWFEMLNRNSAQFDRFISMLMILNDDHQIKENHSDIIEAISERNPEKIFANLTSHIVKALANSDCFKNRFPNFFSNKASMQKSN